MNKSFILNNTEDHLLITRALIIEDRKCYIYIRVCVCISYRLTIEKYDHIIDK